MLTNKLLLKIEFEFLESLPVILYLAFITYNAFVWWLGNQKMRIILYARKDNVYELSSTMYTLLSAY